MSSAMFVPQTTATDTPILLGSFNRRTWTWTASPVQRQTHTAKAKSLLERFIKKIWRNSKQPHYKLSTFWILKKKLHQETIFIHTMPKHRDFHSGLLPTLSENYVNPSEPSSHTFVLPSSTFSLQASHSAAATKCESIGNTMLPPTTLQTLPAAQVPAQRLAKYTRFHELFQSSYEPSCLSKASLFLSPHLSIYFSICLFC